MRTFLLGFAACALLACGGKVVLDGAGAGSGGSSTGGPDGGSVDGGACPALLAALGAAIEAARACNPDASTDTCTTTVPDFCGCPGIASTQGNGAAEAEAAYQAARAAGCTCITSCLASPTSGHCAPGAYDHRVGANHRQGAAYVFVQNGTTWTLEAKLTASDGAADDTFGSSVSVSGGTALVGAWRHRVGANVNQGAAYVFVQNGSTWTQQAVLTASDGAAGDWFGGSVSMSGGTALVGAHEHKVGANAGQGAAYVFVQSGATWTLEAVLTASDGAAGEWFGSSVSVSAGTALVGAYNHRVGANAPQGGAYVFVQSGTTWTQQAVLTASDGATGDGFGSAVSMSGGTALVGAYSHRVGANVNQGAAYLFVQSGTTWTQHAEFTRSDGAQFGRSVSMSGGTALVGAYQHTGNLVHSAAFVFVPGTASTPEGCGCRVAGEPTPHERSLLATVAAMAMVVGLRRRPRRGARRVSTLRGLC